MKLIEGTPILRAKLPHLAKWTTGRHKLTEEEQDYVVQAIKAFFQNGGVA